MTAREPSMRTAAASSPFSSPTRRSGPVLGGNVPRTRSSSPGGTLQAHPPPEACWVRRRAGYVSVVTVPSLGHPSPTPPREPPTHPESSPTHRESRISPGARARAAAPRGQDLSPTPPRQLDLSRCSGGAGGTARAGAGRDPAVGARGGAGPAAWAGGILLSAREEGGVVTTRAGGILLPARKE